MTDQQATVISTKDAPSPTGPYVQALTGAGLVFVSGQLPITSDGRGLQQEDFATQVRQALANVFGIIRAGGSTPDRVLKVTAFVVGTEHSPQFNAVYAEAFGAHRPTRSMVTVPQLPGGYLVEIEAIALQ